MKLLKQEKGSITLFVLISMIFFVMYLVGMYMLTANSESTGVAESARIKEIYEQGVNNIDDVYETLTSQLTLSEKITAENYGDYVNYPVNINFPNVDMQALGHKTDWRIFYKDSDGYVYLTTSYYLPYSKISSGTYLQAYEGRPYSAQWRDYSTSNDTIPTMQDTTNYSLFRPNISGVTTNYNLNSDYNNSKCVSALVNTNNWTNFIDSIGYADYAIGAPTLEMWIGSWNEKGYTKLYCDNTNQYGYYVGTTQESGDMNVYITSLNVENSGYTDSLYFPITSGNESDLKGYNYFLASPAANSNDSSLMRIYCGGNIGRTNYYNESISVRPVVRLKATVGGKKDANGVWQLSNATNIKVTAENQTIELGETTQVTAGMPKDMPSATVTWSSSNTNVATVSNDGTITSVGNGTTIITATATNEKGQAVTGSCKITVYQDWTDITAVNYGDYVNYPVDIGFPNVDMETLGHKTDWRIFYKDNDGYVYLTTSYCLPYSEIPTGTNLQPCEGKPYSAYWLVEPSTYTNIPESIYSRYMMNYKYNGSADNGQSNMKFVSQLMDTNIWNTKFKNEAYAEDTIGAPTLEMWIASWNEKGYTKLYCNNTDSSGYFVGTNSGSNLETDYINMIDSLGYNDSLYFPISNSESRESSQTEQSDSTGYRYWLASPAAGANNSLMSIVFNGNVTWNSYNVDSMSVRPVVRLKATVNGQTDANGIWQLK